MNDYEQRIQEIQMAEDLSADEQRELLEDLKYEIEMDDEVSDMELKANLMKTINVLAKVI